MTPESRRARRIERAGEGPNATVSSHNHGCRHNPSGVRGGRSFALNGRPGAGENTRRRILEVARAIGWTPSARAGVTFVEALDDYVMTYRRLGNGRTTTIPLGPGDMMVDPEDGRWWTRPERLRGEGL